MDTPRHFLIREKPEELKVVHGHAKKPGERMPGMSVVGCLPSKQNVGKRDGHNPTTGETRLAAGEGWRIAYLMTVIKQAGG